MKKIFTTLALVGVLSMMFSCTTDYPELVESEIPQASELDVRVDVDQSTNYVTFNISNTGMVPVWIFGTELIDGKAAKQYCYTGNGISLRFREAGEHSVEVKAYNRNGVSTGSKVVTFSLNETYYDPFDPAPYVKAISGGSTQSWVWNFTENGHFGCGPVGDPLGWWSCEANGKKGFLYDDTMTFDAEGNYTYNSADGQAYANAGSEYMSEYGTGEDYLFPVENMTRTYRFENNWNDAGIEEIYLCLESGSIMSYVPHKSAVENPRFQVLETSTSSMRKKLQMMSTVYTPNNPDGISWYYEFIPEGSATGDGDPLYGVTSKTWILDNETSGYMGCGPDVDNPTGWWAASPHEKDNFGVVDDEITFYASGKYVFDPGENGMVYCNWDSGYRPEGHYSGDGSTDYDAPAEVIESTYTQGSDSNGDYIELPAGVLYGYIANKAVLSDANRLTVKELTEEKLVLVANFEGISWQFIYRPKDGQVTPPEPEPEDYTYYDINGAGNLWKSANVNPVFWFADGGWSQISDPEYEMLDGNGIMVTVPEGTGGSEWQGQTQLQTDIPAYANQQYDFCFTMLSSESATYTVKLAWKGNDVDHAFFYVNDFSVEAGEPTTFKMPRISPDVDYDAVTLFVDMGRAPVGTQVSVRDICFQKHTESWIDYGAGNLWAQGTINPVFWFADGGWSQISDPEYEMLEGNGIKVTIPEGVGGAEWQGQTQLQTNVPASASKQYDFVLKLTSTEAATFTVKLAWKGNDVDHAFFYVNNFSVKADTPTQFTMLGISPDVDYDTITLFVDMGRAPVGAEVTVSDICFQEHVGINWDIHGAGNLWASSTVNPVFWFADGGWSQIADPEYEMLEGNGIQVTIPDGIGGAEWQGQTQLQTNIPASASKRYDFCLTLNSSEDATFTVKLAWKGNDVDHAFFYANDFSVKAGVPATFVRPGISPDVDYDAVTLFVDMGRTPVGAVVEVYDICLQEHK